MRHVPSPRKLHRDGGAKGGEGEGGESCSVLANQYLLDLSWIMFNVSTLIRTWGTYFAARTALDIPIFRNDYRYAGASRRRKKSLW